MHISDISSRIEANKVKTEYQHQKYKTKAFETRLKEAADKNDLQALKDVADDFEEVFVNLLLKEMRKTVGNGGLLEKSQQEKIFEGMLDESYAETAADAGGLGISNMVYNQLKQYTMGAETSTFDKK